MVANIIFLLRYFPLEHVNASKHLNTFRFLYHTLCITINDNTSPPPVTIRTNSLHRITDKAMKTKKIISYIRLVRCEEIKELKIIYEYTLDHCRYLWYSLKFDKL